MSYWEKETTPRLGEKFCSLWTNDSQKIKNTATGTNRGSNVTWCRLTTELRVHMWLKQETAQRWCYEVFSLVCCPHKKKMRFFIQDATNKIKIPQRFFFCFSLWHQNFPQFMRTQRKMTPGEENSELQTKPFTFQCKVWWADKRKLSDSAAGTLKTFWTEHMKLHRQTWFRMSGSTAWMRFILH